MGRRRVHPIVHALRERRRTLGNSQTVLGNFVGLSRDTLSHRETGLVPMRLDEADRIARALGMRLVLITTATTTPADLEGLQ